MHVSGLAAQSQPKRPETRFDSVFDFAMTMYDETT